MKLCRLVALTIVLVMVVGLAPRPAFGGFEPEFVFFRFPVDYMVTEVPGENYVSVDRAYVPDAAIYIAAEANTSRVDPFEGEFGEGLSGKIERARYVDSLSRYINSSIVAPLLEKHGLRAGAPLPDITDWVTPIVVMIGVYGLTRGFYEDLVKLVRSKPIFHEKPYRFFVYQTFAPKEKWREIVRTVIRLADFYVEHERRLRSYPVVPGFEYGALMAVCVSIEYNETLGLPKPTRGQVVGIVRELRERVPVDLPLLVSITPPDSEYGVAVGSPGQGASENINHTTSAVQQGPAETPVHMDTYATTSAQPFETFGGDQHSGEVTTSPPSTTIDAPQREVPSWEVPTALASMLAVSLTLVAAVFLLRRKG